MFYGKVWVWLVKLLAFRKGFQSPNGDQRVDTN